MEKITSHIELLQKIQHLDQKREESWQTLKEQVVISKNKVNPIGILANAVKQEMMPKLQSNDFLRSALGLTVGFLAKSIIIGSSINPIKLVLGNLAQWNANQLVVKNNGTIPQMIAGFKQLFTKKKVGLEETSHTLEMPPKTTLHPHD